MIALPSVSFYRFCEELLEYYREDPRIMHIAGNSHQYGKIRGAGSYYSSRYANFSGWATWRRAWRHYDPDLCPAWELQDDWSAHWQFSMEAANRIAIVPSLNLVKNIGFGQDATHTVERRRAAFLPALELSFALIHPEKISVDRAADTLTYYANFRNIPSLRLMWLYQTMDLLRLVPSRLRKAAAWIRGRQHRTDEVSHG
jgi:hypothetical protein